MLTGCSGGDGAGGREQVTVFAAASLTEAFMELAASFESEHPGSSVVLNFDGSQRLRFQLEHGAQADVFASADEMQMERARESGLLAGEIVEFASNRLVIIVPGPGAAAGANEGAGPSTGAAAGVGSPVKSIEDLSREGVKLALAQEEVPAGRYARAVVQRMAADPRLGPEYAGGVLDNLVTEESSVRNVLQKVALGEVDAGFVYCSDVQAASGVSVIEVPDEANVTAGYTAATLKGSNQPYVADAFIDFILSGAGQDILRGHGFGAPSAASPSQPPGPGKERLRGPQPIAESQTGTRVLDAMTPARRILCQPGLGGGLGPAAAVLYAAFIVLPVAALLARAAQQESFLSSLTGDLAITAMRLSILTSLVSMAVVLAVGTPFAYLLARSNSPLLKIVDSLVELPIVLPPVVAGVAMLMAFGRQGILGSTLETVGVTLPFTTAAVVFAQVFVASPFYVRAAKLGFQTVARDYEDVSQTLGVSPWWTFWRLTLPLAMPSLLTGLALAWARALSEFGATIMFAGNLTGKTQTMPLAIMTAMESSLDTALALSVMLMAGAVAVLLALGFMVRRQSVARP